MDTDFVIEDLRGTQNAPADFRLTRKIPNDGQYSLLFQLNDDRSTLSLTRIEKEMHDKLPDFESPDFKIPDLTIPETIEGYIVSKILSFIFRNNKWLGIGRFTIPNTIRHIRGNAFGGCIIKELYIPASVCEIQPLAQNSIIYSIKIDKGNKCYDSRNDCNAIIDTVNNELILGCINTTVPDTVTKIGKEAFYMCGCGVSMEIIIPQSVLIIGEVAFYMCSGLKKAVIASSIIGESAFSQCRGLKEILLFDSVTQIDEYAFSGCESIKEIVIPNSVIKISSGTFEGCSSLEKILIPNSVTSIGENAFRGCESLKEVVIPNSVTKIGKGAFSFCNSLEKVSIPPSLTIIEETAFCGCEKLKEVIIPDSVTIIGEDAFDSCKSLKEVLIPNSVTIIEAGAFQRCSSLERIVIPDSVISIGKSAFYGCDKIEIKINNSSLLIGTKNSRVYKRPKRNEWVFGNKEFLNYLLKSGELDEEAEALGSNLPIDLKDIYIKLQGLQDPEALRIILHETLKGLYWDLFDGLKPKEPHRINELFIQLLDNPNLIGKPFIFEYSEFVKYIRLFGVSPDKDNGSIDLYIDMSSGIVTTDKNNLYIDESIVYLDDNYELNPIELVEDVEIVEYSNSSESIVLNGDYQAVVTINKQGCCEGSTYLNRICNIAHYGIENFFRIHEKIFRRLSPYRGGNITNYFSLSSLCVNKYEMGNYCLFACIGIDGSKASKECVQVFVSEFKAFLDKISNLILRSIQDYKRWQQAVEGAISKVMTRNSEHNHGSHVLAHLSNDNSYEKLCDDVIKRTLASYNSDISVFSDGKNQQLPFFLRYLKNRGSYQSEAVFGVSTVLTSKMLYGDVFKDLDQERILLNYISGVSDFSYKFRLLFNGNELNGNNDIAVAMPGDVIGCQAFYVIIENIIRNTAKHATKQSDQVTTFTIDFYTRDGFVRELDDLIYRQNVARAEHAGIKASLIWHEWKRRLKESSDPSFEKCSDYYCVEIDNGIRVADIDELVIRQNELINSSLLDRNFNLRPHSLGLIEMATSAAFLRQISISKIDSDEYRSEDGYSFGNSYKNLVILKAINKNGALGYRFFVQKPKEFLLVGDFDIEVFQKEAAGKEGVQFISEEDFAKAMSDGKSFAHSFLLYPDKVSDKTKDLLSKENDCKTLLPIRKVALSQEDVQKVIDIIKETDNILPQLKDYIWKKYIHCLGFEDGDIHIGEVVSRRFNNCCQIVFENHGTKQDHENNWNKRANLPELWVDNLSSRTQSKLPLFAHFSMAERNTTKQPLTCYIDNIPLRLKLEIFEAYHNKVVVLDERVQRFALEHQEGQIPSYALFESTNVVIPKTKLDPEQFDDLIIHELENFVNNEIEGAFLLVHYGIMERIYKTEHVISKQLEAWSKKSKRVVVTSGRGSHSLQLPDSVCFANLPAVLNAFTENRCKYVINCLINQSRRKNE